LNGVIVKSNEYTVTYYTDEDRKNEMGKNNKITLDSGETSKTVYVKITGKPKGNFAGSVLLKGSYTVYAKNSR
jgi:hypothetical protein